VTLPFLIMLTTTHLENAHFIVFAVSHYRDCNCCARHQGRTNLQFGAVSDSQNLVDNNLLAYVRSNLFYFNFFASRNPILLAAGFYDRVHVDLFDFEICKRIFTEPASITFRLDLANSTSLSVTGVPVLSIIGGNKPTAYGLASKSNRPFNGTVNR
jgi:hypothetical protein